MFSDTELRDEIAKRLDYDAKQGAFFRKAGFTGVVAGARIGSPDSAGKLQATFLGKRFQVAHLVWLVETRALPEFGLAHKNGENGDDRFFNLERTDSDEAFFKQAHEKFDHDLSQVRYRGLGTKVKITCSEHGEFDRTPSGYLRSAKGCPKCCEAYAVELSRKTPEEKMASKRASNKRRYKRRDKGKERERQRVKREVDRDGCNAAARKHYWRSKHTGKGKAGRVCRAMITRVIKQARTGRTDRTEAMHGYTMQEFKLHIEQQFESWMTWGNHGQWHVDHIVTVGWLIDHGVTDPKIINALDNLRPLEAVANMRRPRRYAA